MDYKPECTDLSLIENIAHGGPDYSELRTKGIRADALIDFSVSINPYPLPRSVKKAASGGRISAYPDPEASELRDAISSFHGRAAGEILPVNGLSQGIRLLSSLLLSQGKISLIAGPTYGEYEKYSLIAGAEIIRHNDTESLCRVASAKKPAVLWLCNPNNPTGTMLGSDELSLIAKACGDGYLIIDEAYINFLPPDKRTSVSADNIVIMRSMTKDFALTGLRLGYIAANSRIIEDLKKLQPIWSVNASAQRAGTAAIGALAYYERQWEKLRREKSDFVAKLGEFGLTISPGAANFILARLGPKTDPEWKDRLLCSGILVRDCASFGLPGFVRIGVLNRKQNLNFIRKLRRLRIWEK